MPSRESPLHLALLGCGHIATRHARTIRRVDRDVTLSFASRDATRAARFAHDLGGTRSWTSYDAATTDPTVDAVLVTTPPSEHLRLVTAALLTGKHVIVEKPAFLTSADAACIAGLAAQVGRLVLVAENYAYKPLVAALRESVTSGRLGDVRFVSVQALKRLDRHDWRDDAAIAGGGALLEGGIHWLHLMASLGLTVEAVQGWRPGPLDTLERSMLVTLRYAEGAVGTLAHSWEIPGRFRGLQLSRIAGTRGSLTFESNGVALHEHARGGRGWRVPGLRDIEGYRAMFADFFRTLRSGDAPRMTLGHAIRDLQLVEAAGRNTSWT
jgi:predicted dehydrogenase